MRNSFHGASSKPSHKWEVPRGCRFLALVRRDKEAYPPRSATEKQRNPKAKSGTTRRARALRGVWRCCSFLTDPCGYARRSRLASHHELLLRGLLLFMRWLLVTRVAPTARRCCDQFSGERTLVAWRRGILPSELKSLARSLNGLKNLATLKPAVQFSNPAPFDRIPDPIRS